MSGQTRRNGSFHRRWPRRSSWPSGMHFRLSHYSSDPYRRAPFRAGGRRRTGRRVHPRGIGAFRPLGLRRHVRRRRPDLHGDELPGPGPDARDPLYRLGHAPAHRHGRGQPGPFRAAQHLERPQRHHGLAGLRLDPDLHGKRAGSLRPDHLRLQDRGRPESAAPHDRQPRRFYPEPRGGTAIPGEPGRCGQVPSRV